MWIEVLPAKKNNEEIALVIVLFMSVLSCPGGGVCQIGLSVGRYYVKFHVVFGVMCLKICVLFIQLTIFSDRSFSNCLF